MNFLGYILPIYDKSGRLIPLSFKFFSGLNPKGEITSSEIELEPAPLVQYMEEESSGI